ncbi:hypothetical protein BH24GEM2_BH24GEM2_10090 [soil metagenome]
MEVAAGPKMFHARKATAACHTIKKTLPDVIAIADAGRFQNFQCLADVAALVAIVEEGYTLRSTNHNML